MITKVIMPQAGQTMEEGTIMKWVASEGDLVNKGDILFEVETDKAIIEVESLGKGVLRKILYKEGSTIPVLETIAIIADPDEDISGVEDETPSQIPSAERAEEATPEIVGTGVKKEADQAPKFGRVIASPAARRVAKQLNVDLAEINGSGPGGRITEQDVNAFAESTSQLAETELPGERRMQLSPMRKAIAKNLVFSKQNIPHFYLTIDVGCDALYKLYRELKSERKVTLNDFIVKAAAMALCEFPEVNSRIDGDTQVFLSDVNIGIAVSVEDGLRVPVVEKANELSLFEIAEKSTEIIGKAREGKMVGSGKGTFTISNLGMYGITEFIAVINPPEAAILAIGKISESLALREGKPTPIKNMKLTLSGDHRAFDGVTGAKFLSKMKELLESPEKIK